LYAPKNQNHAEIPLWLYLVAPGQADSLYALMERNACETRNYNNIFRELCITPILQRRWAFPQFRGSRVGLFSNLSMGEFCPLRIAPINRGLRFPPLISCEKTAPFRQSLQKSPSSFSRMSETVTFCKGLRLLGTL